MISECLANLRPVVTGLGVLTPIGNDVETFWKNAVAGRHGFEVMKIDQQVLEPIQYAKGKIPKKPTRFRLTTVPLVFVGAPIKDFDGGKFYPERKLRDIPIGAQYGLESGSQAGIDAGVLETYNEDGLVKCRIIGFKPEDLGIQVSTATGGATYCGEVLRRIFFDWPQVHPLSIEFIDPNRTSSAFHDYTGITGTGSTESVACSSGLVAHRTAALTLLGGQQEELFTPVKGMFIIGYESLLLNPIGPRAYMAMRAYTQELDIDKACRPFESELGGVVIGDGSIATFMEPLAQALERRKYFPELKIYGELIGIGDNTIPNPLNKGQTNIDGIKNAMKVALRMAKMKPEMINLAVAHAPATKSDWNEARAIYDILGPNVPITAPKSLVGHAQGFAGNVNIAVGLLAMRDGLIPPIAGLENPRDIKNEGEKGDITVDYVIGKARETPVDCFMVIGLGLRGRIEVQIWRKIPFL